MSSDELDKASQPEPFSKTRRAHTKSRAGCFNCRKRRVKCDEKHPVCRSCRRREALCVWPEASPTHFLLSGTSVTGYHERSWEAVAKPWRNASLGTRRTFRGSPSAVSEPSSTPSFIGARSVPVAAIPGETYKLSDLALMHHWTRSTSVQTGVPKDHVEFFQSIIPEVGFTNSFVSHAILSVAALHIAHLSKIDREQHIIRAVQHHNAGLEGFRNAVSVISEKNSEALFIWSTLNSLYVLSLATQSSLQAMDRKDIILGVEWIPMLQGVTTVLHPVFEHLQQGRVKNMLTLPGWKDLDPDKPSDGWLNTPLSRVQESWKDSPHALTYVAALSVLRKCMLFVSEFDGTDGKASDELGYNRALSGSLVFIHASPRDFFTLLHKREPPALILFAYFGVLLHGQRDCWVIDSLGRDILEVVGELLDSRWKRWLPKGTDFPKATLSCGF